MERSMGDEHAESTGLSKGHVLYPDWLNMSHMYDLDPLLFVNQLEGSHIGQGQVQGRCRQGWSPVFMPIVHSPNMVSNRKGRCYWRNKEYTRCEGIESTDSGFSSPDTGVVQPMVTSYEDSSDDTDSVHIAESRAQSVGAESSSYRHHQGHFHTPVYESNYNKRRHQSAQRSLVTTGERPVRGGGNYREHQLGRRPSLPDTLQQHFPPDRFLARAHLAQVTRPPAQLQNGGEWNKLSLQIYNKFMSQQQTSDTFRQKMALWKKLFVYIRTSFPRYGLFLVGSTMNGFGSDCSDVDMCLMVRAAHTIPHHNDNARNEAIWHLAHISRHLKRCDIVNHVGLIHAKVPILRFQGMGFSVDLNCNNAVGIRNTHLLFCYSQLDSRVRPLLIIVKLWAASHDINDAKRMTISSYSLSLMVIHFLQHGVKPAVLPCLHQLYRDKFNPNRDVNSIVMNETLPPYRSHNKHSLGQLLLSFLCYYTRFDYSTYAISVRLATKVPIEECRRGNSLKNDPHQWKYLCIEEPFDLTNTARSVYDAETFERIKQVLRTSYRKLENTRTLESIFK